MDKQITQLLEAARAVLARTDVIDQLDALDQVLFKACPDDPSLIAAHTANHVAFMISLADSPQALDRILALMQRVQQEIVTTKRQLLTGRPATATVH